jgi:hypothetical protein
MEFHDPVIAEMARLAQATKATMASTQAWYEFNAPSSSTSTGVTAGSIAWKATDDSTQSNYTANPIVAPSTTGQTTYSMQKVQCLRFAGTWNALSAFTYTISPWPIQDSAGVSTAMRLVWNTVATTSLPAPVSTSSNAADQTAASVVSASFIGPGSPFTAATGSTSTTSTASPETMYPQAFRSQIYITSNTGVAPGDITQPTTITAAWTES